MSVSPSQHSIITHNQQDPLPDASMSAQDEGYYPSLFITGITGYVGGDVYHTIIQKHPSWERNTSCLVRNKEKGDQVLSVYPSVRIVYGSLDEADLIENESSKADIILHLASAEHSGSAKAISRGLQRRDKSRRPAYWISISGSDNIAWEDCERGTYGEEPTSNIYDDWENLDQVFSLPQNSPHRDVEEIELAAAGPNLRTAIVCPPCIYGLGRGPGNHRSIQIPELVRYTIQNGHALQVGRGLSSWPHVHIQDLSRIFLSLAEAAAKDGAGATWNAEGYYFAENGELVWGNIAKAVAHETKKQGLIHSPGIRSFSAEEADGLIDFASIFYGASSRCKAIRARKILDWQPRYHSVEAGLADAVKFEAERLGKNIVAGG